MDAENAGAGVARQGFKKVWTRTMPEQAERSYTPTLITRPNSVDNPYLPSKVAMRDPQHKWWDLFTYLGDITLKVYNKRIYGGLVPLLFATLATPAFAAEGEVEEIVVTGTYLKRTTADSPSPLSVVSQADIAELGAVEITDVINSLTYNSGNIRGDAIGLGGDSGTGNTSVNLRNMGIGSTLVLLNGKRSVASSFDNSGNAYVDLGSMVPNIAIERVEVVKDGASALYGSDAIAGVVNFITQDDYEGFELEYTFATDDETGKQDDRTVQAIFGVQNDQGGVTVAASFFDRDPLTIGDRFDYFGRSGISGFGQPGSYVALAGIAPNPNPMNPAGSSSFGASADLDCDLAVESEFRGSQGSDSGSCLYDFSSFFPLTGEQEQTKVFMTAHYQLADNVELYGDAGFSDNQYIRRNSLFPDVTFAVIPSTHPALINDANRRGIQPVPYLALQRMLGGHDRTSFEDRPVNTDTTTNREFFRVSGGMRIDMDLGDRVWTLDASLTRSERNLSSDTRSDTITSNVDAAYAGLGGPLCNQITGTPGSGNMGTGDCFYYNPFASSRFQPDGSPQTDPMLMNPTDLYQWMAGEIIQVTENTQTVGDVVLTGDLFDMSNGPVQLALGAQWRRDEIDVDFDKISNNNNFKFVFGTPDYRANFRTMAFFAEVGIPLLENLEVNIAARFEDFEDINEDTFDPKITLMWRATDDLTIRASAGSSFRVGSLLQLFGATTSLLNSSDPFGTTGGLAFRPTLTNGNPELTPESADAFNIGVSWAPAAVEGLSIDIDYYNFKYEDIITREAHQDLINKDNASRCPQGVSDVGDSTGADAFNPSIPACGVQTGDNVALGITAGDIISIGPGLPDKVIRNERGDVLRTQASFLNAQSLDTSGIDFNIAYQFSYREWGLFRLGLSGSYTIDYDLVNPDGVKIDGVGKRNEDNSVGRPLPEYKLSGMLGWTRDRHSAVAFIRYMDGYEDDQVGASVRRAGFIGIDPNENVDSFTTIDVQYNVQLPSFGFQSEGSSATVGVKNLTNEEPPHVNTDFAYDQRSHDPRGHIFYFRYNLVL